MASHLVDALLLPIHQDNLDTIIVKHFFTKQVFIVCKAFVSHGLGFGVIWN